jgi:hypothetical protein
VCYFAHLPRCAKKHCLIRCVICSPEIQGKIHTIWCVKIHTFLKTRLKVCEFDDKRKTPKTHLEACFLHTFIVQIHTFFRKIHNLSCVKKHALRCVNLATEGVLKIHTLFFRVYRRSISNFVCVCVFVNLAKILS